jgi:hypothetical protein
MAIYFLQFTTTIFKLQYHPTPKTAISYALYHDIHPYRRIANKSLSKSASNIRELPYVHPRFRHSKASIDSIPRRLRGSVIDILAQPTWLVLITYLEPSCSNLDILFAGFRPITNAEGSQYRILWTNQSYSPNFLRLCGF